MLDEPTSSMDNRSELYIKRQLQSLSASQTLVLITHKMSMLNVVDRLIVMEKGKIIADGPRDEVLERLRKGE